jgi:hypothetical protein
MTVLARASSNLIDQPNLMSCCHGLVVRQSPASKDVSTEAKDIVGIRYLATASEDIEDSVCAVVRSRVRELARTL